MAKKRDYKKEYREYGGKPEQIKHRSERNKARRMMGLKVGGPERGGSQSAAVQGRQQHETQPAGGLQDDEPKEGKQNMISGILFILLGLRAGMPLWYFILCGVYFAAGALRWLISMAEYITET